MKPHKWAKEIKAWADGAEIEFKWNGTDKWVKDDNPSWNDSMEFRIKPQSTCEKCGQKVTPSLKELQYLYAYKVNAKIVELYDELQMAWDGKMLLGKIKLETDDE